MTFHKNKKIVSTFLSLAILGTMAASVPFSASADTKVDDIGVSYEVHGQTYGWNQGAKTNGSTAATTGKAKRLEAVKIQLTGADLPAGASIVYQVHGQTYGWSQSSKTDGSIAGTTGKAKRIEAIRITLKNMPGYSVTYRVHQQTYGWSDWVTTGNGVDISNAAVAGITGKSKRLEAIEIKVVKNSTANVSTADELAAALADSAITTINLKANITASPTITRPVTINFGSYTITGDVSFNYTDKGTSTLTGNSGDRIIGKLTVNTPNASFNNGVKVSGTVNIENVEVGTWTESAVGNTLNIADPDGAVITINGKPNAVNVSASASGNLTLNVDSGASVGSITSNVPVYIVIAEGATVTDLVTEAGAAGSIVISNGQIETVTTNAQIGLIANVAPTNIVAPDSVNVAVFGKKAGDVTVKADTEAPNVTSLKATIDGKEQTAENNTLSCYVNDTVTSIVAIMDEKVTVADGAEVKMNIGGVEKVYGTISLGEDGKTLTVTPIEGNEVAGLAGTFTFTVEKDCIKDLSGNSQAYTFTLNVSEKDTAAPNVVSLKATIDGKEQTAENNTLSCYVNDTVTSIVATMDEKVTVADGAEVKMNIGGVEKVYGTISLGEDGKTLTVTPIEGNEVAGLAGTFTFTVEKDCIKDLSGNSQAYTFTLNVSEKDTAAPNVVSLKATIDGKEQTAENNTLSCYVNDTVTSIVATMDEKVTVADGAEVKMNIGGVEKVYGTVSLGEDGKTLTVTPIEGNEVAGLAGTFTFTVAKDCIKDLSGNSQAYTFTLNVSEK